MVRGWAKVCLRHLGHMTKMAATPIYGKNSSKTDLHQLLYVHVALGPIKVCSNEHPRLTLTYFTATSNLFSYSLRVYMGKLVESHFKGKTYSKRPE